jgi:predicted RNase H-like HicB family nuclease
MSTIPCVYWQDGDMWLGYLQEYRDYMTQGTTLEELQENLRDILADLTDGAVCG